MISNELPNAVPMDLEAAKECQYDSCRKKLNVVQRDFLKCRCQRVFCNAHRPPEKHACTYDYKVKPQNQNEQKKHVFVPQGPINDNPSIY